jgi:two-component system chemotaxis sensor kinase CheA
MEDLLKEFLTETNENLDLVDVELVRFENEPANAEILANIFRLVHTIKGTCGFLGLPRLEALAHAAENLMGRFRSGMPVTTEAVSVILATIDRIKEILVTLDRTRNEPSGGDEDLIASLERMSRADAEAPALARAFGTLVEQSLERPLRPDEVPLDDLERAFREAPGPEPQPAAAPERRTGADRRAADERDDAGAKTQTIRVQVETLEHLMTLVSELVLTRNQLLDLVRRHENSEFKAPLQRLSSVTADLQDEVMKTRMQPIGNAWAKLPRLVRDLAADLGKQIHLERAGTDTELDRQVLELIRDPLTHMVRNSCDHGIEPPAERLAAGKPEMGTIRISAFHEGGQIVIEIADDGRGLDFDRIRSRAVRLGLASAADAEKLGEAQLQKFIFAPGFSTAASVTSVSGRGVGMDVVKNNIDQIGGTIDLASKPGQGTTFTIRIPLTLAIVSALIVAAGGERFAIPQMAVAELVRLSERSEHRIERINAAPVIRLRNRLLPLLHLRTEIKLDAAAEQDNGFIVVMQVGHVSFGLVVDKVFHTEEIVVKPMSSLLRGITLFSGNTILGDGSVILIIDPNGLAAATGSRLQTGDAIEAAPEVPSTEAAAATRALPLLVFHAGAPDPKAVPLALVTRLEEVDAAAIEFSNGMHVVQYRGALMPLVPVNATTKIRSEGRQPLVVFSEAGRSMGLVVDEIVDIVEDRLDIQVASRMPGVLGSAVIRGRATEILDVGHYLPLAHEDWLRRKAAEGGSARRLLLVDDSAFFRNMLGPVLQAAGFAVTAVGDGEEALARVSAGGFDLVVCDLEMPGLDGFALAERLRADPRFAHLPLIALSSHAETAVSERGRAVGFNQFVAKFDRRGLLAALSELKSEWAAAA